MRLAVLAIALVGGCEKHATPALPASSADPAALAEADALWELRVDETSLTASLDAYERAVLADPTDRHALGRLARGFYFWGDAFTDDEATKLARWQTAIEWGDRCLQLNPEFAERVAHGTKPKDAASVATTDDVPCLYWESTALGKWAKLQNLSSMLKHMPTVRAYMTRVEELDPSYFHAGPARYWGAYYAALPSFGGRDLDRSAQYLQVSLDGEPDYFATRVIRAEYWAVQAEDRASFHADLTWVIAADPASLPDEYPENCKEQEKAHKLLDQEHELFFEPETP